MVSLATIRRHLLVRPCAWPLHCRLPPEVHTKWFRGEFEKEMRGQKGMPVDLLVVKTIAGIEAGKSEIRPGPSNRLYMLSRVAPGFPFVQTTKMG